MGQKGAKLTQKATVTCQLIVKELMSVGEITSRKMIRDAYSAQRG